MHDMQRLLEKLTDLLALALIGVVLGAVAAAAVIVSQETNFVGFWGWVRGLMVIGLSVFVFFFCWIALEKFVGQIRQRRG